MTVIAYRAGILAADTAISAEPVLSGFTSKIARTPSGWLVGAAGLLGWLEDGVAYAEALARGERPLSDIPEGAGFLIVSPAGAVGIVTRETRFSPIKAPFYAIGSAEQFALGAMAAGADASSACAYACQWVHGCGGEIETLTLKEERARYGAGGGKRIRAR